MVTHTRNWSSAFNPSKCTQTAVSSEQTHTHTVNTAVACSRTPQSWYWRWREHWLFTPPTNNPCRTGDSNPQPLDYKPDSLTIRPRLPFEYYYSLKTVVLLNIFVETVIHYFSGFLKAFRTTFIWNIFCSIINLK